jgi:RhoGAP domain
VIKKKTTGDTDSALSSTTYNTYRSPDSNDQPLGLVFRQPLEKVSSFFFTLPVVGLSRAISFLEVVWWCGVVVCLLAGSAYICSLFIHTHIHTYTHPNASTPTPTLTLTPAHPHTCTFSYTSTTYIHTHIHIHAPAHLPTYSCMHQVVELPCNQGLAIPWIIKAAVAFLDERGMEQEGLFRVPASNTTLKQLKAQIDGGGTVDFASQSDCINSAACLMKLYLRELPVPLMTFHLYTLFINTTGMRTRWCCSLCASLFVCVCVVFCFFVFFSGRMLFAHVWVPLLTCRHCRSGCATANLSHASQTASHGEQVGPLLLAVVSDARCLALSGEQGMLWFCCTFTSTSLCG